MKPRAPAHHDRPTPPNHPAGPRSSSLLWWEAYRRCSPRSAMRSLRPVRFPVWGYRDRLAWLWGLMRAQQQCRRLRPLQQLCDFGDALRTCSLAAFRGASTVAPSPSSCLCLGSPAQPKKQTGPNPTRVPHCWWRVQLHLNVFRGAGGMVRGFSKGCIGDLQSSNSLVGAWLGARAASHAGLRQNLGRRKPATS